MRNLTRVSATGLAVALCVAAPFVYAADDIKAQIESANEGFMAAFAAGDAAGLAALYTDDGQIFATGMEIVSGAADIEAFWSGLLAGPAKKFVLNTTEVEGHGDTAIEVGYAELFDAAGTKLDTVKYIVVWKQVDGKWKLHRDIFNTNTPAE